MSRWAGVLLQRLNEIYIDNTPGTHSDTCHIKTVPVILNGLGVKHVHFPLLTSVRISLVQSDTKWLLISVMCHMGKKLALNLSFTNLTRLNRCPYLYPMFSYSQRRLYHEDTNFYSCVLFDYILRYIFVIRHNPRRPCLWYRMFSYSQRRLYQEDTNFYSFVLFDYILRYIFVIRHNPRRPSLWFRYRHRFWHLSLIIWPSQWATVLTIDSQPTLTLLIQETET